MSLGQLILTVCGISGALGMISVVPIWLMTHIFMIHQLDKVFLGKTLKGTLDDNLWMINARWVRYTTLCVLHKRKWYRAFMLYPEKRNPKLKGFKFLGFSNAAMNPLEYESKLQELNLWQRCFLYWTFWSYFLLVFGGGLALFLNSVCGIPIS